MTVRTPHSARISFTAYYTGEVWRQAGWSDPMFASPQGRVLYGVGRPIEALAERLLGVSIRTTLLQRHQLLDYLLHQAIAERGITQVVELACGLSPRGLRFAAQYPQLHYLEADLPQMAASKQRLLAQHGSLSARHQVWPVDILAKHGAHSISALLAQLDPSRPTLVLTEGLVNYFPLPQVCDFWQRLAESLRRFERAGYYTDLYPNPPEHRLLRVAQTFKRGLALATRSTVTLHFNGSAEVQQGVAACGFAAVQVHLPEDYRTQLALPASRVPSLVRVVTAWV